MAIRMEKTQSKKPLVTVLLLVLLLALFGGLGFFWYQGEELKKEISALNTQVADIRRVSQAKLTEAAETISKLSVELQETSQELNDVERDLRREEDKNRIFEDQIRSITGTVNDLNKLSKTDKELLQKYSKVYFLNENYIPSNIKEINERYVLESRRPAFFHGDVIRFLERMLDRAERDGIELKVVSAYRSFDEQTSLKGQFTQVYGTGANTFSADQGYSEHQLGTAVDLTDPATGGTFPSFADTKAYEWLLDNAHRYGFSLSYPEGNQFYVFEPWHWRFVGTALAGDLKRANATIYDWDQRRLDEYLLNIFD